MVSRKYRTLFSLLFLLVLTFTSVLGSSRAQGTDDELRRLLKKDADVEQASSGLERTVVQVTLRADDRNGRSEGAPPVTASNLSTNSNAFVIDFRGDAWTAEAKTAFQHAAAVWSSFIGASVPVEINAYWEPLGSGVLGQTDLLFYRWFSGAPRSDTWYPSALANQLAGEDIDTRYVDAAIYVASNVNWYLGTDRNPSTTQYDLATVAMSMIGNAMAFSHSFDVDSEGFGSWGLPDWLFVDPIIYDRFVINGMGQPLLDFPRHSIELGAQLTSNDIFFSGSNAAAANGGVPPKLYAPNPWEPGLSIWWLDEDTYPPGNPNALMTPYLSGGEANHNPGPVALGVLRDLGWSTKPPYSITGYVRDGDDNPVSDVTISAGASGSATTGVDGSYTLEVLEPGTYTLIPSASGWVFTPPTRTVIVPPDATRQDFIARQKVYAEPLQFTPLYPYDDSIASTVMQGGDLHRYHILRDEEGTLVSDAILSLSPTGSGTSDNSGIVDLVIDADSLADGTPLPIERVISVTGVTVSGTSYEVASSPHFTVEVQPRPFTHQWRGGTVRKVKGGISAGLVAYLEGQVNGGLEWGLEETDPSIDSDDNLNLREQFRNRAGFGAGLGADLGLRAEATTQLDGLSMMEWQSRFATPYADQAKKAQAAFALSGLGDMVVGVPGQPLLAAILSRLRPSSNYADYTDHIAAGIGAQWKPYHVHAGADIKLGIPVVGVKVMELKALDTEQVLRLFGTLTDYQTENEWGLSLEQELGFDVSALAAEFPTTVGAYVGQRTTKLKEELFFDKETLEPVRLELSFTGEGNPSTFSDIALHDVTYTFIAEGDDLQVALDRIRNLSALLAAWEEIESEGLIVGGSAALQEVNAYLTSVPLSQYRVTVGTEESTEPELVPEIELSAFLVVDLGAGVEFGKGRSIIVERGYATMTGLFPTEIYPDLEYGSTAGKSIWDLLGNAAHGAWLIVRDFFNSATATARTGIEWSIEILVRAKEGVIRGGARLWSGGSSSTLHSSSELTPLSATEAVTVTAVSWVPMSTVNLQTEGVETAIAHSSGDNLAVGGIYNFQPYTLTMDPAATLVITYTDDAASSLEEDRIGMFRWNPNENNWQPMTAISDTVNNAFTSTITQLGTFALGYDATKPQISISAPEDGSTIANSLPLIGALVVDEGAGIDPETVEMRLSDQVVAADYITSTGQLRYLPAEPLANDTYTVTVSAADVMENANSASATFTVNVVYKVYLPLVLRSQ